MTHLEQDAIRFARGAKVSDMDSLRSHLAECGKCSELVAFVKQVRTFLQLKRPMQTGKPDIDRELQAIGIDRNKAAEMLRGFAEASSERRSEKGEQDTERLSALYQKHMGRRTGVRATMKGLTRIEAQVLSFLLQGMNYHDIATQMGLSESTIGLAHNSAFTKLSVSSQSDLEQFAHTLSPAELKFLRRNK
jgi:DNA-binding CsgD family transcriptional regulator